MDDLLGQVAERLLIAQDGFYYDVYCGGTTIASADKDEIEKFFEQVRASPEAYCRGYGPSTRARKRGLPRPHSALGCRALGRQAQL